MSLPGLARHADADAERIPTAHSVTGTLWWRCGHGVADGRGWRFSGVIGAAVAFEWRFQRESGVLDFITPLAKALCHKG